MFLLLRLLSGIPTGALRWDSPKQHEASMLAVQVVLAPPHTLPILHSAQPELVSSSANSLVLAAFISFQPICSSLRFSNYIKGKPSSKIRTMFSIATLFPFCSREGPPFCPAWSALWRTSAFAHLTGPNSTPQAITDSSYYHLSV